MASATFVLKEPNSKDKTLIYLLFRYQGQKLKYSTKQQILPKFWNFSNQRVRETRQFKQYGEFNALLKKIEDKVFDGYRKLLTDSIVPTTDRLRKELNRSLLVGQLAKQNNFINFIKDLIKDSIKRPNTIASYQQTLNQLEKFKPQFKREMTFDNIDLDFYEDFMKYCLGKNYSPNTIGSFIKNIKVFMNEAVDKKLTTNTEFKNRRFKKTEEEAENIYLTEKELSKLYNKSLVKNKSLDRVRDMFIIGCYTGLRFSDLFTINNENLIDRGTKLRIKTEKTGEIVIIPLHKYIREIIKKHGGIPQYKINNQKMNESLKDLGKAAGIEETVLISSTQGGKVETKPYKKYELISVHTARRSFATNAYLKDIPTISIMKITGHKTEKSFLKYIKISQADNANKLISHPFFK
ncbi:MAG TPA: site-specific integrase [Bacteroidia bacterium]|jgi:integrase|nr:site-specific integrase [Bacteroidia bacterium]